MRTTLPCVDGEALPQYVARTGKLPALQALAFAGQLLAALDRAHRAGLAYTGFQADDVVVMLNGRLALVAWAYAKRGPLRLQPAMDEDLFTAAAIAFELMTGRPAASRAQAPAAPWFPPSHAGLPLALDAVFERALSPDAGQRYPTAAALWQALWSAMGPPVWERQVKQPIVLDAPRREAPVRAPVPAPRVPRQRASRPGMAVAAVAAAMLVAFGVGAYVSRGAAPVSPQQAVAAAAPVQEPGSLPGREAPPREEIVAGSPSALEPREAMPPPPAQPQAIEAQAQPPSPAIEAPAQPGEPVVRPPVVEPPARPPKLVAATTLEATRPVTAPATRAARPEPARVQAPPAPPRAEPPPAAPVAQAPPAEPVRARVATADERPRQEPVRMVVASRTATRKPASSPQRLDTSLGCTQDFVITREWCRISKCETAEYRGHPVCKAIRDEQRRRDLVADQVMRTR